METLREDYEIETYEDCELMERSWNERSIISQQGGSGYWVKGDLS